MAYNPPLIFGPIPPESNPPIEPQFYNPNVFNISAITTGPTTTITTVVNNNYVVGQLVRLTIPSIYKAQALNEQSGYVMSIPNPNQVVLNISSINSDQFVANPSSGTTQPQIMAIGDINSGQTNTGRSNNTTYIPGSFINVSP